MLLPPRSPCRVPADSGGFERQTTTFYLWCDKTDTAKSPLVLPRWRSAWSLSVEMDEAAFDVRESESTDLDTGITVSSVTGVSSLARNAKR